MTIIGIAIAAASNGHKLAKFQPGMRIVARIRTTGKAIEAAIEASETYRHTSATTTHIVMAASAQIV
jgi:hypothetical protein